MINVSDILPSVSKMYMYMYVKLTGMRLVIAACLTKKKKKKNFAYLISSCSFLKPEMKHKSI